MIDKWPPPTIADVDAVIALSPVQGPYLPWSAGAMRPAGLVTALNEIAGNGYERIVECGGGISSVFIARLLAQKEKGTLLTLEIDKRWERWLMSQLRDEVLDKYATVVSAPLKPCPRVAEDVDWYSLDAVEDALEGLQDIQLLLVDGPPAYEEGKGLARLPALPVLHDALAPDASIVLDDIGRPGEQEVLRRWEDEFSISFEIRDAAAVAVTRLGDMLPFPRI